jgi:hypothetical protein
MTPEEERFERIERTLEFLAANQAQLSASSQTQASMIAETARLIAKNSEQIGQLTELTLRIGRIVEEQAHRLDALGRETDQRIKALAESQTRTDDRLNTLINVVERYFSNGHHRD